MGPSSPSAAGADAGFEGPTSRESAACVHHGSRCRGHSSLSASVGVIRVAEGIVSAYKNLDNINVPIIVRLQGTNADKAKDIIDTSGLNVLSATAFDEAANKVQSAIS